MYQLNYVATALALLGLGYAQEKFDNSRITPLGPQIEIPFLGLGTWNLQGLENTTEAIVAAMQAGYRHFDGATAYQNQKNVAAGIKEGLKRTGLKRSDIWVTTKIWSTR
jgi:diketogulonate reductase-like aldo/keto reductase